jgi:adenosylmethionine-8-amino-7-oxononanoate aminotransferase
LSNDHSRTFFHGHTFTGNPIACAVALKSLELTLSETCAAQRARIANQHKRCVARLSECANVTTPRSRGTILAFEIQTNEASSYINPIKSKIMKFFRERGILIRPLGNTIYCMPPFCTREAELAEAHEALLSFTQELQTGTADH